MKKDYTVYIEQDSDGVFIGSVPSLPSCYAQGETQEEMLNNLREVVSLCVRNNNEEFVGSSSFVGLQKIYA